MTHSKAWLGLLVVATTGCFTAPSIVLVDRHTALEEQAAARLPVAEMAAVQAGAMAGPTPLTTGELARSGWHSEAGHDAIAALYGSELDDATVIDQLLIRRCVGEARDGTLVTTPTTCSGSVDVGDVSRHLERANRNRRQVWAYLQANRPGASAEQVQGAWRAQLLVALVCGGQFQRDDSAWEVKSCP